jgi:hypothetical protein
MGTAIIFIMGDMVIMNTPCTLKIQIMRLEILFSYASWLFVIVATSSLLLMSGAELVAKIKMKE